VLRGHRDRRRQLLRRECRLFVFFFLSPFFFSPQPPRISDRNVVGRKEVSLVQGPPLCHRKVRVRLRFFLLFFSFPPFSPPLSERIEVRGDLATVELGPRFGAFPPPSLPFSPPSLFFFPFFSGSGSEKLLARRDTTFLISAALAFLLIPPPPPPPKDRDRFNTVGRGSSPW